ncbi:MAG TPA: peroxiredoxin-like family protein [Pseudonocardia sp.]|jgi:peroxiredoxin|nr:peroxiredoxin-like family protein [Pseudonocardia sp.]
MYRIPDTEFDLDSELDKAREFYRNHAIPADALARMDQQTEELVRSEVGKKAPALGATAPDFALPNAHGSTVALSGLLGAGPVVLTFYRGQWCPYCNLALRGLQQIVPRLTELGAALVAVSPQTPDNSLSTVEKNHLEFEVLSDPEGTVAGAYGLAFEIPRYLRDIYEKFGHPLPLFNGEGNHTIPVPGTFVLDRDATVRYRFVDVDYTRRADPAQLVSVVTELRA